MEFTQANGSDADPKILFAELAAAYFQPEPTTCLWVGLNDDGEVISHLFATIDNYYGGKRFLMIHQLWKDKEYEITAEDKVVMFGSLMDWGKRNGCDEIRVYAMNKVVAKIFEEGYGFSPMDRTMLSLPIEPRE